MKQNKIEKIICPNCNTIQKAKIKLSFLFWPIYIHKCKHCKYIIMESEWQTVKKLPHYFNKLE